MQDLVLLSCTVYSISLYNIFSCILSSFVLLLILVHHDFAESCAPFLPDQGHRLKLSSVQPSWATSGSPQATDWTQGLSSYCSRDGALCSAGYALLLGYRGLPHPVPAVSSSLSCCWGVCDSAVSPSLSSSACLSDWWISWSHCLFWSCSCGTVVKMESHLFYFHLYWHWSNEDDFVGFGPPQFVSIPMENSQINPVFGWHGFYFLLDFTVPPLSGGFDLGRWS